MCVVYVYVYVYFLVSWLAHTINILFREILWDTAGIIFYFIYSKRALILMCIVDILSVV